MHLQWLTPVLKNKIGLPLLLIFIFSMAFFIYRASVLIQAEKDLLTLLAVLLSGGLALGGMIFLHFTQCRQIEQQARLMALFAELNPAPVLRLDADGKVLMTNSAAVDIFGMGSLIGLSLDAILPDVREADLAACLRDGTVLRHAALIGHRLFYFVFRGSPDLGFVQIYGSDITERKQAEAALRTAHDELGVIVNQQVTSTHQVVVTTKEISATSLELAQTMQEVTNLSEESATAAASSQSGLARMEATMQEMEAATHSIAEKLSAIQERAADITSVVTTITKVADQTNLLSLNAAIEAEKSGEYGRGFAVVAREIRRLADQTAVATLEIERIVYEMRAAVSAGVVGMEQFSQEVHHGVENVRTAGGQLEQIIDQVQALPPRFEMVNEGMQAQAEGAQQISIAMARLNEAAQQTADALHASTQAIAQLHAVTQGLH